MARAVFRPKEPFVLQQLESHMGRVAPSPALPLGRLKSARKRGAMSPRPCQSDDRFAQGSCHWRSAWSSDRSGSKARLRVRKNRTFAEAVFGGPCRNLCKRRHGCCSQSRSRSVLRPSARPFSTAFEPLLSAVSPNGGTNGLGRWPVTRPQIAIAHCGSVLNAASNALSVAGCMPGGPAVLFAMLWEKPRVATCDFNGRH